MTYASRGFRTLITKIPFGAADYLKRQCADAIVAVETFVQTFEQALPPEAKDAISRFLRSRPAAAARVPVAGLEEHGLRAGILALAALEQEQIRARSERALLYLQGFWQSMMTTVRSG
jgi:hypothetical protein